MDKKEEILEYLKNTGSAVAIDELCANTDTDYNETLAVLEVLTADGFVVQTKKNKYALPAHMGLYAGRLQKHAKGFAFCIPKDEGVDDFYISEKNICGAMNGDTVLVKPKPGTGRSGEAEVVNVLKRANSRIIGTFHYSGDGSYVLADDMRFESIAIEKGFENGAKNDYKVVAEITGWPDKDRYARGRIIEVLGHKDEAGVDMLSILSEFQISPEFQPDVIKAASRVSQTVSEAELQNRLDLREKLIVTIDGADAKDLDDAISIEKTKSGYRLGVHIADVSHYIQENSLLDKEAYSRGTSVYLPGKVYPMLPPQLSNSICSLNESVDRLTLSCIMDIDRRGEITDYDIRPSVINTAARMTYDDVNAILAGDRGLRRQYERLGNIFDEMDELSTLLAKKRDERGSIDFDLDEAKILLDESGKVLDIKREVRGKAERLIEEFMLSANETVCQHLYWQELPCIYRVHETPDGDKIDEFAEFIEALGYKNGMISKAKKVRPKMLQAILKYSAGRNEARAVSQLMLRSMKKARYCEENFGHFGLALEYYCHFTSPIRRYPDLLVHRALRYSFEGKSKLLGTMSDNMKDMASQCSQREKAAMEAERAATDLKKCEYLQKKLGKKYSGIISSITSFGFYVELENTCEGLVRLATLLDDYYEYDEKRRVLRGAHSGKTFSIGEKVDIIVAGVDMSMRNVDFEYVND